MPKPNAADIPKHVRKRRRMANAFLERNRGKPQYRHAPSVANAVGKVMRPLSRKFGPGTANLRAHWREIVGEKWARICKPVALRGSKSGQTLTVEVEGSASVLIQAHSGQMLEKINQFFGHGSVSRIRTRPARQSTLSSGENSSQRPSNPVNKPSTDLQEAFERLRGKLGK